MAKASKTALATNVATLEAPESPQSTALPPTQSPADTAQEPRHAAREGASGDSRYAADPHEKITVSLDDARGGQAMHLLRSHRFKQMQIRFDGAHPDDDQRAMLKRAGWIDRTERDGIWTKQIDQEARWQSVQQMEREFRDVANSIRAGNKLGPVLEGLGAA
jgi:hypothetical protein